MKSFKSISNVKINKTTIKKNITPLPKLFTSTLLTISGVVGDYSFQNGNYVTSSSSNYNTSYQSYIAFNGSTTSSGSGDAWVSGNNSYSITTGQCVTNISTTLTNGTILIGEWLGLQIPNPLSISSYSIVTRNVDMVSSLKNTGPTVWSIIASNTGVNGSWILLDSQTVSSSLWHLKTVPITFSLLTVPTTTYLYYRIVIKTAGTQYSYAGIKQLNFII